LVYITTDRNVRKMKKNLITLVDGLHLPQWLVEKNQRTNYALCDFMHLTLMRHRSTKNVFDVSKQEMDNLKKNDTAMGTLMNMPFLVVSPAIADVLDWRVFIDGTPSTLAVATIQRAMPPVDALVGRDIYHYNRTYVQMLKDVLHMSVLAAPLLGISLELAEYLRELTIDRLEIGVQTMTFPLFRWRFKDPLFWHEYAGGELSTEVVAHYIMQTSPIKAGPLPHKHDWSSLRLDRPDNERFADAMMRQGCRASTAADLFKMNTTTARLKYKAMHGRSSSMGNRPHSLTFYVETPVQRLQASAYAWLYRSALAADANIPEALIATNDLMSMFFGSRLLITPDRGWHLTRTMSTDARLRMEPCRSCGTHYVLANHDAKIELGMLFTCAGCLHLLAQRKPPSKRKVRND
jgi:hypothetical protein